MKLRDLLPDDAVCDPVSGARDVSGIAADSRAVQPGFVFVAIPGSKADGAQFIPQALANGAVAIVVARGREVAGLPDDVAVAKIDDPRRFLACAAAKIFPRQPAVIAAVTGTSGKTSVAAFTRQIWAMLGEQAASIGTIGIVSPQGEIHGSLTTPDPVLLHQTLDHLAGEGVTHLVMEASSHGLDQRRLDGVRIVAGAFTNLSRDHLDYHASLEDYLRAKLRLFENLVVADGHAVISADHPESAAAIAAARKRGLRIFSVGRNGDNIRLLNVAIDGFAQRLTLSCDGQTYELRLPLVGAFQVENALVAAGFAIVTGGKAAEVFASLEKLQGAKGRLELAGTYRDAPIFIDYAHKPDALDKTLEALRPYAKNRLVVVFGAGGDRDAGKRPLMGAIAVEKADRVIVTDDNPRSEDPAAIRAAILAAAPGATEIAGRDIAIRQAISSLAPGDVLVIAGKGHETGQIVGREVLPFSDHETVAAVLKERAR
jgi:UDP-N-acetylmuramoyl-L-alanyl-D-glutamate--2,6-diaminopimelate ligase